MSDIRAVPLDEGQFHFLENLGLGFMRAGQHETSTKLLAIALAWKVAPQIRGGTTGASGRSTSAPSPHATASGPSAPDNIVELHGYSRKVPCL